MNLTRREFIKSAGAGTGLAAAGGLEVTPAVPAGGQA
jgi:hypothetical protein